MYGVVAPLMGADGPPTSWRVNYRFAPSPSSALRSLLQPEEPLRPEGQVVGVRRGRARDSKRIEQMG